ncbi:DUF6368 family protein [Streptomyces sp. NBC_01571]|nr:DUF6368 family protein [Streptomyces sp. NBC_01571]
MRARLSRAALRSTAGHGRHGTVRTARHGTALRCARRVRQCSDRELQDGQASVVAGLPGVLGIADDDWMAPGTVEFLRAWAGHPAFRLVK